MNNQVKYALLIVGLLLLTVILTACAGPKGDVGATGVPGHIGLPGNDGAVGPSGPPGSPGLDANPVRVVQFCPGVTVYPSAFLEIGFIIGGKLYAVYSANDGFLAQIPPGNYSSNAVGSACNFTVNPDLSISH